MVRDKLETVSLSTKSLLNRKIGLFAIFSIFLILFFLSLYSKYLLSNFIHETYLDPHWNFIWTNVNSNNETEIWFVEAYNDANYYYYEYLYAFRYLGWNPYMKEFSSDNPLTGYAYGPFFIYGLYFISLFVSLFNPSMEKEIVVRESVMWTHIVFDALCVAFLYILVINIKLLKEKTYAKHLVGITMAVVYNFSPFNIIYVDSLYLNIPQMTFFTLVALFYFQKELYTHSAFFLSIAWLSKQMPLFLLLPWFLILWKKKSGKEACVKFLIPFIITTLIFSLPWLLLAPLPYLIRIFAPGAPIKSISHAFEYNGVAVALFNSFEYLGYSVLAEIYFYLNFIMLPFLTVYLVTLLMGYFNAKKISEEESHFLFYTSWIVVFTHALLSRGVYKYYNAFLSPFLLLTALYILLNLQKGMKYRRPIKQKENPSKNIEQKEQKIQEQEEERLTKKIVTSNLFLIFLILILGMVFYYFSWIIIIKSRYLHPLYLFILFIVHSVILPSFFYRSLCDKNNYKMIIQDLRVILGQIKQTIKGTYIEGKKILQFRGKYN